MKYLFFRLIVCVSIMVLALPACSSAVSVPPKIVDTWRPPAELDVVGPSSCKENRNLFAYDALAPLDIDEVSRSRKDGLTLIDLTYASPLGGRVPATLVVPDGAGPFAGLIIQHGMPDSPKKAIRKQQLPIAESYARLGAVVIAIDAPFARPMVRGGGVINFTEQDRREQIQLIVDLRRAVDLLLSRPDVDPQRLAYIGISYGGAIGGLLAGSDNRLKGYVLQVGDGGLVTHLTGAGPDMAWWYAKPEDLRRQWLIWMWPIEPIHYVGCAAPAALLFQNGIDDRSVPANDALRYQKAGSEPKTVLWYKAGHGLNSQAYRDQAQWLSKLIGIASYRFAYPRSIQLVVTFWILLTLGSLAFLSWYLWRTRPVPCGARLLWLLMTVFLGPLGLLIYWIAGRQPADAGESGAPGSPAHSALGSAAWAAAGNMCGAILALTLILSFPQVLGSTLILQVAMLILLSFVAGWLVFATARWISRADPNFSTSFRRPVVVEMVSTCLVLAGVFPILIVLIGHFLGSWAGPFGFDLFYPPLWGVFSLACLAGMLVAYPFHLWMIRRGTIRWGEPAKCGDDSVKRLAWYQQVALLPPALALMLAAMFAAIFLSV